MRPQDIDTQGALLLIFAVLSGTDFTATTQREINYAWRKRPESCQDAYNLIVNYINNNIDDMHELTYRPRENIDRISRITDVSFSEDLAEIDRALIESDFRGIHNLKIFKEYFDDRR